jgi:ectoine hydroxylase-related dioxygenase (phytanoyl-CoA dioxygenase family)
MNNPILNPAQIDRFDAEGYLVLENLFSATEVERVLEIARLDPQLKADTKSNKNFDADQEAPTTVLANRSLLSDDAYSCLARSRRVVETMEELLRDEVSHFYHLIMQKDPGTGGWQYHQDYGYHYNEFLYPDYISFMVALEPAVAKNGCIRVYRGSNRLGRLQHQSSGSQLITDPERLALVAQHLEEVHCELTPGSVLFFHGNTLHASGANLSQQGRWSIVGSYVAVSNPWVIPKSADRGLPVEKLDDASLAELVQRHWEAVQS